MPVSNEWLLRTAKSALPIREFKKEIMYWVWSDLSKMGDKGKTLVEDRIDYYSIAMKCFKLEQGVEPTVLTDSDLIKLKPPVLSIWLAIMTFTMVTKQLRGLIQVAPKIETELIKATGHDLMFTHTEMVNKRILEFLRK